MTRSQEVQDPEDLDPRPRPGSRRPWAVRWAGTGDIPAVLELWALARSEHAVGAEDPVGLERLLGCDPEALLVAEADGSVVGTLVAAWDGWRGNMYRLAVHPSYRRRGIGGALIAAGERRLQSQGAGRVTALVAHANEAARAAWAAAGYERDAAIGRFVRNL